MTIELFARILIISHAITGGIALIVGFIVIIAKKGTKPHKMMGNIFSIAMLISAISAIIIALLPNHSNSFLLAIGIFTVYMVIGGKRALKFKKGSHTTIYIDKALAYIMVIAGVYMIYSAISKNEINIVSAVLGLVGMTMAIRDLLHFKQPDKLKTKWLKLHIGKIVGAYISSFTAFIVVNQLIAGALGWLIPGVIGGVYITVWMRKLRKTKKPVQRIA